MESNDNPEFVDKSNKKLSWLSKILKRRRGVKYDLNHNIVRPDELASPWFLKIVLVNLLAIGVQIMLLTLINGIVYGDWNTIILFAGLSTIVGPFMVGILSKFIVDDYDLRLRDKRRKIVELTKCVDKKDIGIATLNSQHAIAMAELKLTHVEEISQLKIALKVKEKMADM